MSRIGKMPIPVPAGVKVSIADGMFVADGPKGKVSERLLAGIPVAIEDGVVKVSREGDSGELRCVAAIPVGDVPADLRLEDPMPYGLFAFQVRGLPVDAGPTRHCAGLPEPAFLGDRIENGDISAQPIGRGGTSAR